MESIGLEPAKIIVLRGYNAKKLLVQGSESSFPSFGSEYSQNEGRWVLVK